ncbi:MAG: glycosyltransferase family 39 protein [Acidobacteriota bacterium]|nr:glycosyltransferase family 39 protein [Acidobacteriota bacterium]
MNNSEINSLPSNPWLSALAIGAYFALFKLLLHFIFNSNYGYFRDELYFIACGEHLALGYPDHAPMVALMAKASRELLGDSLFAIRFFPAVAGAAKVFLTALLVKEFGGKRFATFLACLCVLCAPIYLAIDNLLSMNSLEPVFWMLCVYFAILAIKRENPNYWLWFGAFAGLGLMNKHSMLFFGAVLVAGLLLTNERKAVLNKHFWLGGAIAFLIFLPNIIWQFQNDFATLELLQNVQKTGKNVAMSPLEFVGSQIMMLLPMSLPIWLAGVWYSLFDKNVRKFRFLGICYLLLLALMIFLKAKDYYLAPIYPMLFAAGAVWWEQVSEKKRALRFARIGLPVLIIGMAILVLPIALPVLPVEKLISYQEAIGFKPPKAEHSHEGVLQQVYGDQFGWREMVEKTAKVYHSLPPEEREKAAIWGSNYGEAGAVDFFGDQYNLPKAISGHQSYFLWGPRDYKGEVLIILGGEKEDAEKACESVEETTEEVNHPYSMTEEKFKILICRRTKKPLPEMWQSLKHWN